MATPMTPATTAQLEEVNGRLKKGDGWVGYRYTKKDGVRVTSKFLYFSFYQASTQKFVNTETNEPEEAYRQLLDARGQTDGGDFVLPSEVKCIRYEHLRKLLIEHYQTDAPGSLYHRATEDGGSETTFAGADLMDKYFKRMSIIDMTTTKMKGYVEYARREGYADPTIRRQLGRLRRAFNLAKGHDLINDSHIPTFSLPKDSAAREGFLDVPDFMKLRDAMPEHLQPAVTFLYYTGFRAGAAAKITWDMVSKDNTEIHVSPKITKNKKAIIIPLVGPLTPIAEDLAKLRKSSPKTTDCALCFRNFRFTWNSTCGRLGLGTFNTKTRTYSGLKPHDFRRSAARNLIKAGVDRRTAMKITGHKTEHIFERYNIKTTDDVKEALIKVGTFSSNVAELAASR